MARCAGRLTIAPLTTDDLGPPEVESPLTARLCLHEAAHTAAAHLLGRGVGHVRVTGSSGWAQVQSVREGEELTLDQGITELVILLVPAVVDGRARVPGPALTHDEHGDDEDRAHTVAMRVSANSDEARSLVEYGRSKARTLAGDRTFCTLVDHLALLLEERGELDPATVEAELRSTLNGFHN